MRNNQIIHKLQLIKNAIGADEVEEASLMVEELIDELVVSDPSDFDMGDDDL